MQQDRDEPIHAFGVRLRGQTGVCKLTIPCTGCRAEVSYADAMLRDMLCRGLGDQNIRLDLLSDKNQDMTLEQVFKFIEAKEIGKCSATHLLATIPHRCTLKEHIPLWQEGVSQRGPCTSPQGASNQGQG